MDIPNDRSSHTVPTPSGGGLAIVGSFYIGMFWLGLTGTIQQSVLAAIIPATLVVAVIGQWDDIRPIPARWRMAVHMAATIWVLFCIGGITSIQFGSNIIHLGWFGWMFAGVLLVWHLNLFNFMDGIDGLAGMQVVYICFSATLITFFFSFQTGVSGQQNVEWLTITLGLATIGFLYWNWPPAKIFMGDVGSGFLGLAVGIVLLVSVRSNQLNLGVWLILLAAFLIDASYTLLRRMLTGKKWYQAHCTHAYQQAAKKFGHLRVTLIVLLINCAWLLPNALLAAVFPRYQFLILLLAYLPLLILVNKLRAGEEIMN
ncbi:MAG: glycosyltransferase family 4 protein [Methylococcaceae bacterium]